MQGCRSHEFGLFIFRQAVTARRGRGKGKPGSPGLQAARTWAGWGWSSMGWFRAAGFAAEVKELWQLAEAARSSLGLGSHGNGAFWHVSPRTTSRQRSARERKMLGPAEREYWGKSLKPRPTRTSLPPKNHLSYPQTNLPGVPVSGPWLSSHP